MNRLATHATIALTTCLATSCASPPGGPAGLTRSTVTTSVTTSAPPAASPSATPSVAPARRPVIPDGTYRNRITKQDITDRGGADPSMAGTWTLKLDHGKFQLYCAWVDQDGDDCGHDNYPDGGFVEAGTFSGDAIRLWIIDDLAAIQNLSHCRTADCGALGPYYMTYKLHGDTIAFADTGGPGFAGLDPVNNYTITPWTKIS